MGYQFALRKGKRNHPLDGLRRDVIVLICFFPILLEGHLILAIISGVKTPFSLQSLYKYVRINRRTTLSIPHHHIQFLPENR